MYMELAELYRPTGVLLLAPLTLSGGAYPMAESSVVRRTYVRTSVNFFFKVYLLLQFESDLLETWYTCSLGERARCVFGGFLNFRLERHQVRLEFLEIWWDCRLWWWATFGQVKFPKNPRWPPAPRRQFCDFVQRKGYLLLQFESDLSETWYTCSLGEGA